MDIDTQRIRELLDKRDAIDAQIVALIGGTGKKTITCSLCKESGHSARSCSKRELQSS